jgi:type 1 glutamine amidotransferase
MSRRSIYPLICMLVAAVWTALLGFVGRASADDASEKPKTHGYRILMLTQSGNYEHSAVKRHDDKLSVAEQTVTDLGISSNLFRVDCSKDVAESLTKKNLQKYDIVFFYTQGNLNTPHKELDYFINNWLKQRGHGYIGTHAASDTYHNYAPYREMLGGEFQEHPWYSTKTVWIKVHDKDFPAMKPWGDEFKITDEIYHFKNFEPDQVHVLMSMDMAKTEMKKPYHEPIAWCRKWGDGKVFFISLGHNETVWENPKYQECLLAAIKWDLNLVPGDATPNPEYSAEQEKEAKEAYDASQHK